MYAELRRARSSAVELRLQNMVEDKRLLYHLMSPKECKSLQGSIPASNPKHSAKSSPSGWASIPCSLTALREFRRQSLIVT